MKRLLKMLAASAVIAMTGCTSVHGLIDAGDDFGCPYEGGVRCQSLSDVHESLHADSATSRAPDTIVETKTVATDPTPAEPVVVRDPEADRSMERIVTVWVLPWVDKDGDLHEAQRIRMRTQEAAWRLERVRTDALREKGWK